MSVEISGLDEALQGLEELRRAITPEALVEWTYRIQQTATANCGESVVFKGSVNADGKFNLDARAKPEGLDCLIDAINLHLPSMHPVTRAVFEKVIYSLMAEKAKTPTPVQSG